MTLLVHASLSRVGWVLGGTQAVIEALLSEHRLGDALGENSPIGRLYALDGQVLLLGVDHGNNTSLHLAEYRCAWPGKTWHEEGAAMLLDGERRWQRFTELKFDDDDFVDLGLAFEKSMHAVRVVRTGAVGRAESRLFRQRTLVDWAVTWMGTHRR